MDLPEPVRDAVEQELGQTIVGASPLRGGQVSPAARIDTSSGPVFVKWNIGSESGIFGIEAQGLRALAGSGGIRVPNVIASHYSAGDRSHLAFGYLLLEFVPSTSPDQPDLFSRRFAEGLADLHHRSAAEDQPFGLECNNYLGSQPQRNLPRSRNWAEFYRQNRLLPQIERARKLGHVPAQREYALMRLIDRLDALLEGMPEKSSLIHGDLWSGNFLCAAGDEPVLIDPAVYYAPREMEVAYIELFGGFPPQFVGRYSAAYPLDPEYPCRRSLHQLYPLLIHLNHFGEEYGLAIDRVCAEYDSL